MKTTGIICGLTCLVIGGAFTLGAVHSPLWPEGALIAAAALCSGTVGFCILRDTFSI